MDRAPGMIALQRTGEHAERRQKPQARSLLVLGSPSTDGERDMRAASSPLALPVLLVLAACGGDASPEASDPTQQLLPPSGDSASAPSRGGGGGGGSGGGAGGDGADPAEAPQPDAVLAEVVYVLIGAWNGGTGFCTGALVSRDIVLTAGHCVDSSMFGSFEVVAPLAPGSPRVSASRPVMYTGDYDTPASPDIGVLRLDEPIDLPAYAEPTDVVARLDGGEAVSGVAVVRTEEEPEAPLRIEGPLAVSSAVKLGYAHGLATPMFSAGGDSGAGLFLVEKGRRTHKLIGIARQPEPERGVDHFTRIDPTIGGWLADNAQAGE